MIHLALPRDLVLPVFVGWLWLGYWASVIPSEKPAHPVPRVPPTLGDTGPGVLVRELLEGDGPWIEGESKRSRLERFRNGWMFAGASALAVVLCWLCVFVSPYWWL